jgi:hypothetical protein
MSWFADDAFADEIAGPGIEIGPGAQVERRAVLLLPLALLGTAWSFGRARGQEPVPPRPAAGRIGFDAVVDALQPLAEGLIQSEQPNEDAYLARVAARLLELDRACVEKTSRHRKMPLVIMQIGLRPGGAIPFHDHRNYNGVLLGLEGEIRVRNFEVAGSEPVPAKDRDFEIRETADLLLTPGRVSSLSRSRDNVHDLRAGPTGGRVLDVFTFFGNGGSHYMTVDAAPVDAEKRVYRARWR